MLWWKLRQLKSRNPQARRRAVKGLGKSRDPRAIDPLMVALNDKSYLVRKEAARALGDIGDARTVRPLINLIEESFHYAMARTAVGALERVLGRTATRAISKDVQAAAMLSDVSSVDYERRESMIWFSGASSARDWTMDCSQVRKLAHKELIRRGLAV
jgi:HEAT repeat protein